MSRLVREYIEVAEHASLDDVIGMLTALRESLPAGAQAELRMKGDDNFGRRLAISYMRPQSADEAACEARYAHAGRPTSAVPAVTDIPAYERVAGEISIAA